MAKGRKCPCCGFGMYAEREDYQEKGSWVWYVCRNPDCDTCKRITGSGKCTMTETVFEDSSKY